jgi:hypothetical protein
MDPAWCGDCRRMTQDIRARGRTPVAGGDTKQDVLWRICDLLGLDRLTIGQGSSVPAEVFEVICARFGIATGSMPEVGERLVRRAGLTWSEACDSRSSLSRGGSTVTKTGLDQMERALAHLL